MVPYVLLVVSACVYIIMMVHTYASISHKILPKRLVLWVPVLSFIMYALLGRVLSYNAYIGWEHLPPMLLGLITMPCALEVWYLLLFQNQHEGISLEKADFLYLKKLALVGSVAMFVTLPTLFLPLLW